MLVLRKEAAPQEWVRELMKLADVNSNKKGGGGTAEFRNLQRRVIEMAPEMWKERIRNVQFLAKTKGIHGAAIDNIIDEILQASEAEPEPIQDIQDVGCAQLRVSDPVDLPAVKEPLEEKMADAAVADCQEGQHLVAGSGSAASSGGVSAESLNDSATPSAKKPRIMMKLGLRRFRLTRLLWWWWWWWWWCFFLLHRDMCAAVLVKDHFAFSVSCEVFAILSCCRSVIEDTDSCAPPLGGARCKADILLPTAATHLEC